MPSTHSATVSALAVSVGLREGFDTSLFAVAAVFAFIVMYDAAGIRRAAGFTPSSSTSSWRSSAR